MTEQERANKYRLELIKDINNQIDNLLESNLANKILRDLLEKLKLKGVNNEKLTK